MGELPGLAFVPTDPVSIAIGAGVLLYLLLWFPRTLLSIVCGGLLGGLVAVVLGALAGYPGDLLLPGIIAGGLFGFLLLR